MATRRSRLQVKPNIGPKPSRGSTAGGKASSRDVKPTKGTKPDPPACSDPMKPEPAVCSDPKKSLPTTRSNDLEKFEPTEDSGTSEPSNTIKSELITAKQSVQERTELTLVKADVESSTEEINGISKIQGTSTITKKEKSLTRIKSKSPDKIVENEDTTSEKHDKKPETRPKFRSRFPKARPNIANIGRPENRKTPQGPPAVISKPQAEVDVAAERELEPVPDEASTDKTVEEAPLSVTANVECQVQAEPRGGDHEDHPEVPEDEDDLEESPCKSEPKPPERVEKSIFEKPVVPILKQDKKPVIKHICPKKRKHLPPINAPPDRATMKMIDLIYWNPSSNPMTKKLVPGKPKEVSVTDLTAATEEENQVDTPGDDASEDSHPVPQVKIGPDGQIILNEASLVVDNKTSSEPMEADVIEEDESTVNYKSFREKRPKTSWTEVETVKFYKALSTVGTDFSLMLHLFPSRTRREIKNKFKKEEKLHRREIDKAIQNRTAFNMTDFERLQEEAEEEHRLKQEKDLMNKEKKGQRGKKRKSGSDEIKENKAVKTRRRKKKKTVFHEDEDDDLDDAESFRSEVDSNKKPASSRVKEVVEILMDMSRGKLSAGTQGQGEGQIDISDSESEVPSEAPSEAGSVTSVFVPRSVRTAWNKEKTSCNIEEDRTIDNKIPTTHVAPSGDIGHLFDAMSNSVVPMAVSFEESAAVKSDVVKSEVSDAVKAEASDAAMSSAIPSMSSSNSGSVPQSAPTPKAVSISADNAGGAQHIEIPEALLQAINTESGDKMQVVLVHDVDTESEQTLVHVYILPKTAEEISIDGNSVQLTPNKNNPSTSDHTAQCAQSNRTSQGNAFKHEPVFSEPSTSTSNLPMATTAVALTSATPSQSIASTSSAIPSSPITPFRRLSSNTVTLAQTAAVSAVKPSSPTSLPLTSTPHTAAMSPFRFVKQDIEGMNTLSSPPHRVCLFKDDTDDLSVDVKPTVKKE